MEVLNGQVAGAVVEKRKRNTSEALIRACNGQVNADGTPSDTVDVEKAAATLGIKVGSLTSQMSALRGEGVVFKPVKRRVGTGKPGGKKRDMAALVALSKETAGDKAKVDEAKPVEGQSQEQAEAAQAEQPVNEQATAESTEATQAE